MHNDIWLLVDVFETFCNKYVEIYEFDPAHFLSAPRLTLVGPTMKIAAPLAKDIIIIRSNSDSINSIRSMVRNLYWRNGGYNENY